MTSEQQTREIVYQASIAPFFTLFESGVISAEEYGKIDTILTQKYQPFFVRNIPQKQVDIVEKQR